MDYRDALPPGCPPDEAQEITAETELFRLVRSSPPTASDFVSKQVQQPRRNFGGKSCLACGLSVLPTLSDCTELLKLPQFRGARICRIRLVGGNGRLLQTGRHPHHTWWPHREFDHSTCSEVTAA